MRTYVVSLAVLVASCNGGRHDGDGDGVPEGRTVPPCICTFGEPPTAPCRKPVSATVRRVVDGDTIVVNLDGGDERRVRLIGIDAPESDEGDCGPGATAYLSGRLPRDTRVTLAFDAECVDRYGRDLAYVFVPSEGTKEPEDFLNARLLCDGYAQACPIPPDTAYAQAFQCLEDEASSRQDGLWAQGCHRDACFRGSSR